MKVNLKDSAGVDAPKTARRLPKDSYTLRILNEPTFQLTRKDDEPMYVFELELIAPEEMEIDGEMQKISGKKFRLWAPLAKGKNFSLLGLHEVLGLPAEFDTDDETSLPLGFTYAGAEVRAVCSATEVSMKNEKGEDIIGSDGEPVKEYNTNIVRFI